MNQSVGTIYYTVEARTAALLSSEKEVSKSMDSMTREMQGAERQAGSLSTQMNGLAAAIKLVVAATALRGLAGWVQQYQTMSERVRMATDSVEEFEMVQRRLQETADGTYRALEEAQEVYIQTSIGLRDMGYSASEALDIVDSLSYAFVTNQTSSERAQSALNALTRAVNRGTVLVDHWANLLIAVPTILEDIAEGSGYTTQEISRMGYEGKLSADLLTEGLRRARDANQRAADDMATDLIDASVRARNAVTVTLAAIEEQTGAIQAVTDGIIMASEALLEFGQDSEKLESLIKLATVAGASFAAVMAGRVVMSLTAFTIAQYDSVRATLAKTSADQAAAGALVRRTAAEKASALAALRSAQADVAAAGGIRSRQLATEALTAAQARYATATTAARSAQHAANQVMTVGTMAANGLRTALAFLGGPAGILFLVGAAFLTMGRNARDAGDDLDNLADKVETLGTKTLELRRIQLTDKLEAEEEKTDDLAKSMLGLQRQIDDGMRGQSRLRRELAETAASHEQAIEQANEYRESLAAVNEELGRRASGGQSGSGTGGGGGEQSVEFQRLEQSLVDQIALASKVGLAREELAALQKLGAEATDEERARIVELVRELHRLEKRQEAAKEAAADLERAIADQNKGFRDNEGIIAGLREQLYQTTLNAEDLAKRQAELTLNKYATPDQIEDVRALARELYLAQQEAAELERRRQAFADDVAGSIRGQLFPLSGGMFDDQVARYDAEAQAEKERYASQLDRLKEAKELELEVVGGYHALEEQMAQEHADRMAQIEKAKTDIMVDQAAAAFGDMASNLQDYVNTFGTENKALLGMMKAAAIAQTIMQTYQGAQQAYTALSSIPYVGPALGIAAASAAVAGGMARVAAIRSQSVSGRQYGGPVSAGSLYRINENGAPEVFNAANGQQYMMANTRGEVVSNRDAAGASSNSGPPIHQTFHINGDVSPETVKMITDASRQTLEAVLRDANRNGPIMQTIRTKL